MRLVEVVVFVRQWVPRSTHTSITFPSRIYQLGMKHCLVEYYLLHWYHLWIVDGFGMSILPWQPLHNSVTVFTVCLCRSSIYEDNILSTMFWHAFLSLSVDSNQGHSMSAVTTEGLCVLYHLYLLLNAAVDIPQHSEKNIPIWKAKAIESETCR